MRANRRHFVDKDNNIHISFFSELSKPFAYGYFATGLFLRM